MPKQYRRPLVPIPETFAAVLPRLDPDRGSVADVVREALTVLDYTEYGGAPLLGVNGVSVICHGASPPRAIKNAIGKCTSMGWSSQGFGIGMSIVVLTPVDDS